MRSSEPPLDTNVTNDVDIHHEPVLFSGTFPELSTNIARVILDRNTDRATQERDSETFFKNLTNEEHETYRLMTPQIQTALISMPNSNKVELLHTVSVGNKADSSIDGMFVFLRGSKVETIEPRPIALPPSIRTCRPIVSMTLEQFSATLQVSPFDAGRYIKS